MSRYFDQVRSISRKLPQRQQEAGTVPDAGTVPLPKPQLVVPAREAPAQESLTQPEPLVAANPSGIPVSGVPFSGVPLSYPPLGVPRAQYRIRQAALVQDGHSLGEQALYEALWDHAQPQDKESKLITIGYRQMGVLARLTVNNSKANIKSLMQKLAVEEIASFTHAQGTTYRVFSYPAILQRRRDAGLTHYIKSRGVVFVNPETGTALTDRQRTKGTPLSGAPPLETGVPERGDSGTPQTDEKGVPQIEQHPYRHLSRQKEQTSTTTALAVVVRAVQETIGPIDNDAARRILENCYQRVPDATDDELDHYVRLTAFRIRKSTRVENPIGLMIAQVPKCFEGEPFREFREAEQQRRERARELDDPVATGRYQAVIDDPLASEPEKRLALAALGEGLKKGV
jgi:hypothetical protein